MVITRMSRNKRKSVTIVTGLDTYPGRFRETGKNWAKVVWNMCVCIVIFPSLYFIVLSPISFATLASHSH